MWGQYGVPSIKVSHSIEPPASFPIVHVQFSIPKEYSRRRLGMSSNMQNANMYAIQEIRGKCHGLVAATTITKGTRILSEFPLFRVPRSGMRKKQIRKLIAKEVAALQEQQRQAFFSLHNSFEDEDGPELGIVRTNALPLGSDATTGGIFLNSSRINHSCDPTAQNTWNENLQRITIHAIRDIAKDDEITIFYLNSRRNRGSRLFDLQTKFRFTCSCSLCSLSDNQRKISDERWDEVQRLDESIGSSAEVVSAPLHTLHKVQKLLNLMDDEIIADVGVPRAYYDAFQIAITYGDVARARIFAKRAASARGILEGKDSPTVQRMESLSMDPSHHMAYGYSKRWETTGSEVPEDLSKDEFERWLWRKGVECGRQFADFQCEADFPPFDNLPAEYDVDLEFFESANGFSYSPRRHWCFLAEIIDIEHFLRLRLIVKDKIQRELPVAFHTDDRGVELDLLCVKKGFTVAILYAEQHGFMDFTVEIRHESPAYLKEKRRNHDSIILSMLSLTLKSDNSRVFS